jgi:hypothetical protein
VKESRQDDRAQAELDDLDNAAWQRLGLAGDKYERGRPLSSYEQRDLVPRDHGDVLDERVL